MLKRIVPILSLLLLASLPTYSQTAACVAGKSGAAPTASLTFVAPTTNTDGTPVATPLTYNLYQSSTSGAETKVASGLTGSPVSVTVGLAPNSTVYFKITAVENGVESALSNEVCKSFPASVPGTVTITIS